MTRYATIRQDDGTTRAAVVVGPEFGLVDHADAAAAAAAGATAGEARHSGLLTDAVLGPPSVMPSKIICVGLNYRDHIMEMGRDLPRFPTLFAKFADALIGPHDPIVLPSVSDAMDWEVELAVVIGRRARHVEGNDAHDAIGGYTVLNDVTARDWQARTTQFLAGKTFESTTPVGPFLVTGDEIDHAAGLDVVCHIDDLEVQRANTSELVISPADIVSYVSDIVTLQPGDIIATGTPAGVGAGREPPMFLRPGQVVRTRIEGIGELSNTCVAEVAQ